MSFLWILLHLQAIAFFVFSEVSSRKQVASDSYPTCPATIQGDGKVPIKNYSQPLVSLADQRHNRTNYDDCLRKCKTMLLQVSSCFSYYNESVCVGDTIVVDVENNLLAGSTTVHWHGISQMGSQYSDGVPYVTQCPIGPGETFRYQFRPEEAGSFFYHSHSGRLYSVATNSDIVLDQKTLWPSKSYGPTFTTNTPFSKNSERRFGIVKSYLIEGLQKEDGLSGPLIVRENPNKKLNFYFDEDLPEHVVYIQDWLHTIFKDIFPGTRGQFNPDKHPESYLINGRGIFIGLNKTLNEIAAQVGSENQPPVATFDVEQGKIYRFRLISGTCLTCAVSIFVQGHRMTIVSGDGGRDVVPTTVDTINLNSGERFDVLINTTQPIGSYWIALTGARDCEGAKQLGILRYKGAPAKPAANSRITTPGPLIFNPQITYCNGTRRNELCLFQLQSAQPPPKELTMPKGHMRIPAIFGFYNYSIQELFQSGTYDPYFNVGSGGVLLRSLINNITHELPPSPLISQYNDIPKDSLCQPQCNSAPTCLCTNVVKIPLGTVVDVVIGDSAPFDILSPTHPFHLHGYNFYVLKQGLHNSDPVTAQQEIYRRLDRGEIKNPTAPMKDTVSVSPGGYAIIRFIADNPGFWMMHCHILIHLDTGMAVVFQVGEFSDLPPVPQGFPRCGNFLPKVYCPS